MICYHFLSYAPIASNAVYMFENNESKRNLILPIKDHLTETLIILFYKGCLKSIIVICFFHCKFIFSSITTHFRRKVLLVFKQILCGFFGAFLKSENHTMKKKNFFGWTYL